MTRVVILSVIVAACGGGGSAGDDGGAGPDAQQAVDAPSAIDAPPPMPSELPACAPTLGGVIVEGAQQLVVHGADGEPICRSTPSLTGLPVAVPPGGSLTIIGLHDPDLLTIVDPQPGDSIVFPQQPRTFDVTADFPPLPGATSYALTCGMQVTVSSATLPFTKTLPESCLGADKLMHVAIVARGSGGASLGHAALALRPVGVLFPNQGTPVTTPSWTTQTEQVSITVTNAPPNLLVDVCGGIVLGGVPTFLSASCSAPSSRVLPSLGGDLAMQFRLRAQESETWVEARRYPAGTSAITFDVTADALPRVTAATTTGPVARPTLGWTTSRPVTRGVALVGAIAWGTPTGSHRDWYVVAPVTTASPMLFPRLPIDLAPHDQITDRGLFVWDLANTTYAQVRQAPLSPWRVPWAGTPAEWGLSVLGDYDPL